MADLGSSTDVPVYIGAWTNWSRGRILGATLTLSRRDGTLLTAFLAVFVSFVGTSFWRIASFILHQSMSSESPKDGLYHQIQAILRNSGSGTTTLTHLLRVLWAWRRRANQPLYRIKFIIITAALITASFAVASIFSARVGSGMNDEVLVSGARCGQISGGNSGVVTSDIVQSVYYPYMSKKSNSYANYVQTCYTNISEAEGCGSFIKRQLFSTVDRNATCPFDMRVCLHQDRNIKLDSGPIRIDADLGFNVPPDLQYTLRIINHCAPLAVDGYKQIFNYTSDVSSMRLLYGGTILDTPGIVDSNFTYEHQLPSISQILSQNSQGYSTEMPDYTLGYTSASTYNGSFDASGSYFIPRAELYPTLIDSDLYLIFLSANNIAYTHEVNDDWYAAHQFIREYHLGTWSAPGNHSQYLADEPASPLGCKTHYQACAPNGKDCTVSGGEKDITYPPISENDKAYSLVPWVTNCFLGTVGVITALTTSSLLSRSTLNAGSQGPLPDDQWQKEVEYWHNIGLASLQSIVDSALGPSDPNFAKYFWAEPNSFQRQNLCKSQKIRSSAYSNFSILGLALILMIGGLIIALGYTFEYIVEFVDHHLRRTKYSRFEWSANDTLQTQRMVHEELGFGVWEDCAGVRAIPVTGKDENLALLDIQDPTHPRLKGSLQNKPNDHEVGTDDPSTNRVESHKQSKPDSIMEAGNNEVSSPSSKNEDSATIAANEYQAISEPAGPDSIVVEVEAHEGTESNMRNNA